MKFEYWFHRVAALDGGRLRACRDHAVKPPPKRI